MGSRGITRSVLEATEFFNREGDKGNHKGLAKNPPLVFLRVLGGYQKIFAVYRNSFAEPKYFH
jgi:hypothetical protein